MVESAEDLSAQLVAACGDQRALAGRQAPLEIPVIVVIGGRVVLVPNGGCGRSLGLAGTHGAFEASEKSLAVYPGPDTAPLGLAIDAGA